MGEDAVEINDIKLALAHGGSLWLNRASGSNASVIIEMRKSAHARLRNVKHRAFVWHRQIRLLPVF